jgi:predicted CopG family antitoxin
MSMGAKTLSVDEEAYRALTRAKRHRNESFSQVIKRATWGDGPKCCGDLLKRASGEVSESTLTRWKEAQEHDKPPADKWSR